MSFRKLATRRLAGALGLLLALSLVLASAPVLAVPQMGHVFYGDVTDEGVAVAAGTTIYARVDGLEYTTTVDAQGRYGYVPTFEVPADDPDTPAIEGASQGDLIDFYVAEVLVETYAFEIGGYTELILSIGVAPQLPPVAEFSASPLTGNAPLTVEFTDESLNMADSPTWYWEFGDVMCPYCEAGPFDTLAEANEHIAAEHPGEALLIHIDWGPPYDPDDPNAQNPIHQYLQIGTYTVTLTVTTAYGSDTEVKVDYIVVTEEEAFDPYFYDTNGDGVFSKAETQAAVDDYPGIITKDQALEVVKLYFLSP